MVLDFEEQWTGDHVQFCKKFLDRVASKMNGVKPLIYLNQSQLKAKDWSPIANAGYGLWVAAYTLDPNNNNFVTGAWKFAAMQQWTSQQKVPGITGNVDGDVFFGDMATFKKYGYIKPIPTDPCAEIKKQLDLANAKISQLNGTIDSLNKDKLTLQVKIDNAKKDLS